ncbi:hypothetical protein F5051DRAFT_434219 [Lentinula edodes]|nr:hypothetical protein F5051DRAFT_434219 [Lentinula edodes]
MEMKSKVAGLILQKLTGATHANKALEQCAGNYEVKKMFYTNSNEHFTETYGIVVKNWPLKDFKNPSSITSKAEPERRSERRRWQRDMGGFRRLGRDGSLISTKSRVHKRCSDAGQPHKKKRPNGPQTSNSTADNDGNGGSGA